MHITQAQNPGEIKVATYNVSMEAENYVPRGTQGASEEILVKELGSGTNQQIQNISRIIQTVRPDILLLNEFDYIKDPEKGVKAFIKNYLNVSQNGTDPIDYPYFYYSTVNTGQPSEFDLDNNGTASKTGNDAWGYGVYPGQYGMVLLSRFPIQTANVRTFQHFKWKDMPGGLAIKKQDGSDWYSPEAWAQFPLSSKSHWDVPVSVGNKTIHILASHPTPPTFDGPEDRNGKRNHDEIRFWKDYIRADKSGYIYDDNRKKGGLAPSSSFVIVGDLNSSPVEGNSIREGIQSLLGDELLTDTKPASFGGTDHSANNQNAANHTAFWRLRADYVLPSRLGFKVESSGVFWPSASDSLFDLVQKRESSSDHRLVWVKLKLD